MITALTAIGALVFTGLSLNAAHDQIEVAQQGQYTDRYTKAVEQLDQTGRDHLQTRLGGVYALQRLAADSPRDQPTIVNVLITFISSTVQRADLTTGTSCPSQIAPDIQAAFTVLTRRDHTRDTDSTAGRGMNLRDACLARSRLTAVDLLDADLTGANLGWADLSGANLGYANLSAADLTGATLDDANLGMAYLTEANLAEAHLSEAKLSGAKLTGANLDRANLIQADLGSTNLSGAKLGGANLDWANLGGANLTGTDLTGARLSDANLAAATLRGARLDNTQHSGAKVDYAVTDSTTTGKWW